MIRHLSRPSMAVRVMIGWVAILLGLALWAPAPAAMAQPGVTSVQTAGGRTVACLGTPALGGRRVVTSCVLAHNTDFTNSYGRAPSGQGAAWSMYWPRCKAGTTVVFDGRGNVATCTLWTNVSVTNSYGVSPSGQGAGWSFGFTCRANAPITFDGAGNTVGCTSASNQSVANASCKVGATITVTGTGVATCTGGGAVAAPGNLSGDWTMMFTYQGQRYGHRMSLTQSGGAWPGLGNTRNAAPRNTPGRSPEVRSAAARCSSPPATP